MNYSHNDIINLRKKRENSWLIKMQIYLAFKKSLDQDLEDYFIKNNNLDYTRENFIISRAQSPVRKNDYLEYINNV